MQTLQTEESPQGGHTLVREGAHHHYGGYILSQKQAPATVKMVTCGWLEGRMKEKDEWRFATIEYGGQCVTMAGMKWMQVLSVLS